jgi:predicted ATPase
MAASDFPDGVVFVDLVPIREPAQVAAALARVMSVTEQGPSSLEERLADALRGMRRLLVLDNFEHVLPAWSFVLELLEACPHITVLLTSRVALRVRAEREYPVPPLALSDPDGHSKLQDDSAAVALFLDRARAAGVDPPANEASAHVVWEICRRLDGLPLAIELAAAWLRIFPPRELLARLGRSLPMLADGPNDLPDRQQTMRATIDWSYQLLDEREQGLFPLLCVFAGGCTAEAAAAVCADVEDAEDFLRGLARLADANFLQLCTIEDEHRLRMLETLREYGLELLEATPDATAFHQRHTDYFLAYAEFAVANFASPDGVIWRERLDREHDNLRNAINWALANEAYDTALRLTGTLWRFWSERGYLREGRRFLREALAAPVDSVMSAWTVRTLVGAAHLAIDQGDLDDADLRSAEALAHARLDDPSPELAPALMARGRVLRHRGGYQDSIACYDEAVRLTQAFGDRLVEAEALTGLAQAMNFAGDISQGAPLTARALGLLRETGDQRALAVALAGMAEQLVHAGDFPQADSIATEALDIFRRFGDTGKIADLLFVLGILAQYQENYDRASEFHRENLALRRARGDERGTIEPLSALAAIALHRRDYDRARALLEETFEVLERHEDRWARAMSLTLLGHVELATGDPAGAAALFVQGAALMHAFGNLLYLPWCLEGLAAVAAERGAWEVAARLCGARDELRAQLGTGMPPANPAVHANTVEDGRQVLGSETFARLFESGKRLPLEQALTEAAKLLPSGDRGHASRLASIPPAP